MINEKFGKWLVLEQAPSRNKKRYWKCQCECGTLREVLGSDLRAGKSQSCGCGIAAAAKNKKIDLINKIFNYLTVIEDTGERKQGKVVWLCRCHCGKEIKVVSTQLTSGKTGSCGCYQKEQTSIATKKNLLGLVFDYLTVIEETPLREEGRVLWKCKCKCGNECLVSSKNLLSQHTTSCGCRITSKGEQAIIDLLKQNNIIFQKEKSFIDLISETTKKPLRFDFWVNNSYLIEFDGQQHFQEGKGNFDNPQKFQQTQNYDRQKNEYCLKNNIPLIRIPYTHLSNIRLEDLLLETSEFIIKNPEL